jgi:hypothetical protein
MHRAARRDVLCQDNTARPGQGNPGEYRCPRIPPSAYVHTHTRTTYLIHKPYKIQHLAGLRPSPRHIHHTYPNTKTTLSCTHSVSYVCHTSRRISPPWSLRGTVCRQRCKRGLWRWSRRRDRNDRDTCPSRIDDRLNLECNWLRVLQLAVLPEYLYMQRLPFLLFCCHVL